MALKRTVYALLLSSGLAAVSAAAAAEADEVLDIAALSEDDVCAAGDDECSLSLRQLRGEKRAAEVRKHDHVSLVETEVEEVESGAFCCFESEYVDDICGSCFSNAKAMAGTVYHNSTKCTKSGKQCSGCGGTWCTADGVPVTPAPEPVEPAEEETTTSKKKGHGRRRTTGAPDTTAAPAPVETTTVETTTAAATTAEAESPDLGANASAVKLVQVKKTGACSADDASKIAAHGSGNSGNSFPKKASDCGHRSWSLWSGFKPNDFTSCISSEIGVSDGCAACFTGHGKYSYDNCKLQCLFGSWCSASCLNCALGYRSTLAECVGSLVQLPDAEQC